VTFAYDAFGRLTGLSGDAGGSYKLRCDGPCAPPATTGDTYGTCRCAGRELWRSWMDRTIQLRGTCTGAGLLWKVTADGTAYFYHFDGDGNVVAMSNPSRAS